MDGVGSGARVDGEQQFTNINMEAMQCRLTVVCALGLRPQRPPERAVIPACCALESGLCHFYGIALALERPWSVRSVDIPIPFAWPAHLPRLALHFVKVYDGFKAVTGA